MNFVFAEKHYVISSSFFLKHNHLPAIRISSSYRSLISPLSSYIYRELVEFYCTIVRVPPQLRAEKRRIKIEKGKKLIQGCQDETVVVFATLKRKDCFELIQKYGYPQLAATKYGKPILVCRITNEKGIKHRCGSVEQHYFVAYESMLQNFNHAHRKREEEKPVWIFPLLIGIKVVIRFRPSFGSS